MAPRIVVLSLASDFGCQVQMTNMEDDLLAVLSGVDIAYWQLASSGHLPDDYEVAVVEGAVTTVDHVEILKQVRDTARTIIAIGACANTGGIPGLASVDDVSTRLREVYGAEEPEYARAALAPLPIDAVVPVDYHVPGCPIQPHEFVATLQHAVMGLSDPAPREPMCAACKMAENSCFYDSGTICLGLVTSTGCGAKCVSLGRPCTGCRGMAEDASFRAAEEVLARHGIAIEELTRRLELYNTAMEVPR